MNICNTVCIHSNFTVVIIIIIIISIRIFSEDITIIKLRDKGLAEVRLMMVTNTLEQQTFYQAVACYCISLHKTNKGLMFSFNQ